ncbi:lysylphosphatidylglycerol synthase transmembrane domain-containing protein [Croceitalea sp. MTPC9]|uniref:lysylphosphatidylglycerol synthase transmembrane domain-containing protein n=1 Tax=unclassified Croceitalea TaxID=2632280 RepID=UPI002B373D9D|nr:lysylphosphatidylglycerol synthase transmembrane domain-containing protein [Croceitalea sp. MTPC6]GMN16853.1 lysylphosphatidylglycerol synthase transmembrane domain-containing protein [Croceitalea sp. MTPC9]
MSDSTKKFLKTFIPIALGTFLVWYSYSSTSEEDRKNIYSAVKNADLLWVFISISIGVLSHFSRAIRWVYLLKPLGYKPKLSNSFLIVLISYFANILILRSGEFLRATALNTYEDIPFEKGFGTIVTERIIDVIMLLLIIVLALFLQADIILEILNSNGIGLFGSLAVLITGVFGLIIAIRIIKKSTSPFALKIKNFLTGMLDGVLSISKMKNKWAFVFHTFFIWGCYIAMFWVIKFTVLDTINLPVGAFLVAFVAGAFAMATTNGGLGFFPIAVSAALMVYGVSENSGLAYGWIMWTAQTLMVVVFGAISFVLLPLLNRNR